MNEGFAEDWFIEEYMESKDEVRKAIEYVRRVPSNNSARGKQYTLLYVVGVMYLHRNLSDATYPSCAKRMTKQDIKNEIISSFYSDSKLEKYKKIIDYDKYIFGIYVMLYGVKAEIKYENYNSTIKAFVDELLSKNASKSFIKEAFFTLRYAKKLLERVHNHLVL